MTTTQDIVNAMQALLASEISELQRIYTDLTPKDFKRSSILIQAVRTEYGDVSQRLVSITEYLTLTIYDKTDDYTHTSAKDLSVLQGKILLLFRRGYLRVQDRALHVEASTGGRDWDRAYIDLQISFFDNRDETPDNTPMMEHVETNYYTKG